ncbi:MAG: glycosyltransferase family 2 protein [Lachnospiraceae bacterium]|nr:glycosyltransferase family 2 protein [Lachnospiraceae bacterium]
MDDEKRVATREFDALAREKLKSAALAERVAVLENEKRELEESLDRIKSNPLWKASAPLRAFIHWVIRQVDRVRNQGSLRGVVAKIRYKKRERAAYASFGTESFPDEEQRKRESQAEFDLMPKISILTPLFNTPEKYLRDMIESVQAQTYANWELCLADGSDDDHAAVGLLVRSYAENDERIIYRHLPDNKGISGNTNACLTLADGDYIALLDHDDILHPSVLYAYVKEINETGADYLYCDEATFKGDDINRMITMHFKPDYAIDNLRANNYICHFSMFKRSLLSGTELFRPQFDGSQDHDMILRLTDRAERIVHVPRLLYYWRSHSGSTASNIEAKHYAIEAARGAVSDHLKRHGYEHFQITSTRAFETIFKISYEISGSPLISIIIPNCDHAKDLRRLVDSIYTRSTWDNYEIIVVENGSRSRDTEGLYESFENGPMRERIRVLDFHRAPDESFNFSAVVNFGARQARGRYLLFMNNDMEVITINWMEEMLMYAQRSDVGAVGAKLYFPDRRIQHAGIVLALGAHRTAGHVHYKQAGQNLGYMGRLCYAQDMSAVTGACLMVEKKKYDEVKGFDERLAVALNDVDFCLKLRKAGYLNVFTPFAELTHYESASRGDDLTGENARRYNEESELFRERWRDVLDAGDPYYNPNFSLDRSDFSLKVGDYTPLRTK